MKNSTEMGVPRHNQSPLTLTSAVLAFFASYFLLGRFAYGAFANITVVARRDAALAAVLAIAWAFLVADWKFVAFAKRKGKSAVPKFLWKQTGFFVILIGLYLLRAFPNPLLLLFALGSLCYFPVRSVLLYIAVHLRRAGRLIQHDSKILIIGSRDRANDAIAAIRGSGEQYEIIGCFDPDPSRIGTRVADIEVFGTTADLAEYLFGHTVDLIVFALPLHLVPNAAATINRAMEIGITVSVVMESGLHRLGDCLSSQTLSYQGFPHLPTVILSNIPDDSAYLVFKRVLDIVISAILLILLSPVFLVTAVLIKITSPEGPVFYPWKVLGRNRKPFVGYKFRTMVPNAEELKTHLLPHNEMQGPVFKMQSDPRVTPLGRFLRKYSIDELPQLYSVLRGDMSLVGPRPPAEQEADQFEFWQRRKLSVKPGITCFWQVNGRNEIASFDEWARLDIEYIEQASLSCDLRILLRTIPAVVRGKGAH